MQLVQGKHAECSSVKDFSPTPLLRDDDDDNVVDELQRPPRARFLKRGEMGRMESASEFYEIDLCSF